MSLPSPIQRKAATLADTPAEVLSLIASYLDDHSAVSLSLTSKSLRLAAESRLWRDLSVKASDLVPLSPVPTLLPLPDTDTTSFSVTTGRSSINDTTHIYPDLDRNNGYAAAYLLGSAVRQCIDHLDAAAWRWEMVRCISLPLRHTVPLELVHLIDRLRGLTDLRISLPHTPMAIPAIPSYIPLEDIFSSLPHPFSALRDVELALQVRPEKLVSYLLKSAPGLKHLHIHNRTPHRREPEAEEWDIPGTALESLVIESLGTIVSLSADLVAQSPRLRKVAIRDQTFIWTPTADDPLLPALAELEQLDTLEIPCTAAPYLDRGFEAVRQLNVTWDSEALHDPGAKNMIIPPLAQMETYQMDISLYTAKPVQFSISRLSPHIRAMYILGALTPGLILANPRLKTIYRPPHVDFQRESRHIGPDIPHYNSHTYQGILIYSFRRTIDKESPEDELVHFRWHPSTSDAPCRGARCIVCPMGWEDRAWWRGIEVPVNIVSAAYAADGFNMLAAAPQRGKVMSQKGWEVLKYWADGGTCDY